MPNTNLSDLDRAARTLESKLMEYVTGMEDERELNRFDDVVTPALVQLRAALLPRASGVPETEAVAWRWKCKGVEQPWSCTDDEGFIGWMLENKNKYIVDELYAAPPSPIASEPTDAGSGEASVMEEQAALLAIKIAFQRGRSIARIADKLREEGYRITRRAPSKAKP